MPPSYGRPRLRFGLVYPCLQSHAECAAPAARKGLLYAAMNIRGGSPAVCFAAQTQAFWFETGLYGCDFA